VLLMRQEEVRPVVRRKQRAQSRRTHGRDLGTRESVEAGGRPGSFASSPGPSRIRSRSRDPSVRWRSARWSCSPPGISRPTRRPPPTVFFHRRPGRLVAGHLLLHDAQGSGEASAGNVAWW